MKDKLQKKLQEVVKKLTDKQVNTIISIPKDISKGDYTSNVAFQLSKILGKSPLDTAQEIVKEFGNYSGIHSAGSGELEKVEAATPGFINFYLSAETLKKDLEHVLNAPEKVATTKKMENIQYLVEFAHPNTHKEMHIGHMRTLITGESLSRLLESQGAKVFRANYQGDIGPHVAKAIYGIEKIMQEKDLKLDEVEEWSAKDKSHFLGEGYVRGNLDYEQEREKIDKINNDLYRKVPGYHWDMYVQTHKWSMDYYDEFYSRFYTKYDKLFLESQMYEKGKQLVEKNVGKIFVKDPDGSVIFPGERYGLHTRVFITQAGNPTYEGKEMQNAYDEWEASHFDKKIHVVANEQAGYFQVVFKALELLDPEKFKDKQYHLSMGMVQLVGKKMSSRTGDILTVDWLIDQVKAAADSLFKEGKVVGEERDEALEKVTIGAVKYSVLKGGTAQNAVFDIEKSVSLDGHSGPYIQYTYARTQSVLSKAQSNSSSLSEQSESKGLRHSTQYLLPRSGTAQAKNRLSSDYTPQSEEKILLQKLVQFGPTVESAAENYAPNMICEYVFELSQMFNNFYQKYRILNADSEKEKEFRLALTQGVGIVLKQGLNLLGIQAPEKM